MRTVDAVKIKYVVVHTVDTVEYVETRSDFFDPPLIQTSSARGLPAHLGASLVLRRVNEGEHGVDLRDRNREDHDRPEGLERRRLSGGEPTFPEYTAKQVGTD